MQKKGKYNDWSKEELIEEVEALKKQKTYGLLWEKDKTKEVFDYYINWDGLKIEEKFPEAEHKLPVLKEIKDKDITTDKNKDYNLLIEGDNYHALAVLNFTHNKSIDVIYIDPPYNTGNNDFKYNDKWVDADDSYRHSKWLSFMEKRLKLSKELLKNSGVIFISVDDHEMAQLRILCDEIFGEKNRLDRGIIIWNNAGSTKGFRNIVKNHEYVLAYAKDFNKVKNYFGENFKSALGTVEDRLQIKRTPRNPVCRLSFSKGTPIEGTNNALFEKSVGGGTNRIDIINGPMEFKDGKLTKDIILEASFPYRFQVEKYYDNLKRGEKTFDSKGQEIIKIFFRPNGVPYYRKNRNIMVLDSVLKELPNSGLSDLQEIVPEASFNNPKPVELIFRLMSYFLPKKGIALDFMAGSGTTAQAIFKLNKDSPDGRKFILCTNDESKICTEVCYPRISRLIKGYKKFVGTNENLKYFRTDFVESAPTDKNKKKIVDKSTEMICIKENAFVPVKDNKEWRIFKNHDYYLGIIFDEDYIEDFVKEAKKLDKKIHVYVFSLDESVPEKEFKELKNKAKLCPIPEVILHVYRRIFK